MAFPELTMDASISPKARFCSKQSVPHSLDLLVGAEAGGKTLPQSPLLVSAESARFHELRDILVS
jgi:hypothetical protein